MKLLKLFSCFLLILLIFNGYENLHKFTLKNNEIKFGSELIQGRNSDHINLSLWTYPKWRGEKGYEFRGNYGDWENYVIKNFEKKYPNVKIDLKVLSNNEGPQKLNIAVASGVQIDILGDTPIRNFDFVRRGLLANLDEYISDNERAQYIDGILEQCKWSDGKQYMIPWATNIKLMLVNKSIFKQTGFEQLLPTNTNRTWTYEEFKNALKAVSNTQNETYGCGLYAGNELGEDAMITLLENFGANLIEYGYDGKPYASINSSKGAEAASFIRSLVDEQLVVPGSDLLKATDCEKLFATGHIAILVNGSTNVISNIETLMDQNKVKWFEIYPVMYPNANGIIPHCYQELYTYSIFKSENPNRQQTAVDFCKFITGKDYINDLKLSFTIPAYKSAQNLYEDNKYLDYAKRLSYYNINYYDKVFGFWNIRSKIYPSLRELFSSPNKTPKQVLNSMNESIQFVLDEKQNIK